MRWQPKYKMTCKKCGKQVRRTRYYRSKKCPNCQKYNTMEYDEPDMSMSSR